MTDTTANNLDLFDVALCVYRYARRYAVGQSTDPADAVIYDASIAVLNDAFAPKSLETSTTPPAAKDRYLRYGPEPARTEFTLPTSPEDALVTLHRYARRYTNGRGSYTATLVNKCAHDLLAAGISLSETQRLDGTIWAADGIDGASDGLTPEQRAEALSVLPHTRTGNDDTDDPFGY